MPSDEIATLLKQDNDDLTARLENDAFQRRLMFKLGARQRARLGVVGLAGGLGAAFAASQFSSLGELLATYLGETSPALTSQATVQIAGAALLGACAILTALVLRKDA